MDPGDNISASILAEELLARLPGLSSEILRERYLESLSARQIAQNRSISERYAHKLVGTALKEARHVLETASEATPV